MHSYNPQDFYLAIPFLYAFIRHAFLYQKSYLKSLKFYIAILGITYRISLITLTTKIMLETIILILKEMSINLDEFSKYIFIFSFVLIDLISSFITDKFKYPWPKNEGERKFDILILQPIVVAFVALGFLLSFLFLYLVWFSFNIIRFY